MKFIETDRAPKAIGPYSQAVELSRFVFTSGQLGIDPETGKMVTGSFEEEALQVLNNLKAVLEAAGCRTMDIVKTTVFMSDLSLFAEFNTIYADFLKGHRPARSTFQVAALPLGARLEIEAIALIF